jgi:hypothetical protein
MEAVRSGLSKRDMARLTSLDAKEFGVLYRYHGEED